MLATNGISSAYIERCKSKKKYFDQGAAVIFAQRLWQQHRSLQKPYSCFICGFFHLTTVKR